MSYLPPGISNQTMGPGTHTVVLTDIKQITDPARVAKFNAQVVFVATWKSVETAVEIDQIIKFNGSKSDYYAGQTIDRLHLAAGLPEPTPGVAIDISALTIALDGIELTLEVNDRGYANAIIVPEPLGEDVV